MWLCPWPWLPCPSGRPQAMAASVRTVWKWTCYPNWREIRDTIPWFLPLKKWWILTKSLSMLDMKSFAFGVGVEVVGDGHCLYLNPKGQLHHMKALGGTNSLCFPSIKLLLAIIWHFQWIVASCMFGLVILTSQSLKGNFPRKMALSKWYQRRYKFIKRNLIFANDADTNTSSEYPSWL